MMSPIKHTILFLTVALLILCPKYIGSASAAPPVPAEEMPEVMTRGPVNEAFAHPVNVVNEDGFIAPVAPPAAVNETLPAEKPVDSSATWIPGYWAWDSDINDYIWVSGCWRTAPPDMVWIPGYWAAVPGGWQWVSGFWRPAGAKPVEYLPEPPPIKTPDPVGATSLPDQVWVPPCWYWHGGAYVLRSGYWMAARPDWIWIPSYSLRTPRGWIFVNGYWDYPLRRRGVLFAPVRFPRHLYTRPGLSFGLGIVINFDNLQFGLFTRPRYRHYYFGDYYDRRYVHLGIFPRYEYERRRSWYDPIYVHDRWKNRHTHPNWMKHEEKAYNRIRDKVSLRPPRMYGKIRHNADAAFAAPISSIVSRKDAPIRFEKTSPAARHQISRQTAAAHQRMQDRIRRESPQHGRPGPSSPASPSSPAHRIRTEAPRPAAMPGTIPHNRRQPENTPARQQPENYNRQQKATREERRPPSPARPSGREQNPSRPQPAPNPGGNTRWSAPSPSSPGVQNPRRLENAPARQQPENYNRQQRTVREERQPRSPDRQRPSRESSAQPRPSREVRPEMPSPSDGGNRPSGRWH